MEEWHWHAASNENTGTAKGYFEIVKELVISSKKMIPMLLFWLDHLILLPTVITHGSMN